MGKQRRPAATVAKASVSTASADAFAVRSGSKHRGRAPEVTREAAGTELPVETEEPDVGLVHFSAIFL